jgi:hypothetical protein
MWHLSEADTIELFSMLSFVRRRLDRAESHLPCRRGRHWRRLRWECHHRCNLDAFFSASFVRTTFDIYGHRLPHGDRAGLQALDQRLPGQFVEQTEYDSATGSAGRRLRGDGDRTPGEQMRYAAAHCHPPAKAPGGHDLRASTGGVGLASAAIAAAAARSGESCLPSPPDSPMDPRCSMSSIERPSRRTSVRRVGPETPSIAGPHRPSSISIGVLVFTVPFNADTMIRGW